ncbi:MAG: PilZ domain-containing protein [Pseudomonadota bacterium]
MTPENKQRVFVKPDDTATINCPKCQLAKKVAVGKFRTTRHTITARCTCGHAFPVSLEFRKNYRKNTRLPGEYNIQASKVDEKYWKKTRLTGVYTMHAPASGNGHMLVTNISCGGLQFTTPGDHAIEVGQQAQITFTLDDRKQTTIHKCVIIQSVTGHIIGCRFADNEFLEQGLRFYLFP